MIAMSLARNISRIALLFSDYSDRFIEKITDASHQTIGKIRWKLIALNVEWQDIKDLDDDELKALLYPKVVKKLSKKIPPDIDAHEKELSKKPKHRKTGKVIHDEYKLKHGLRAYEYSRYMQLVREGLAARNISMKQVYVPAEILFCDYAGTRLKYKVGGKEHYLNVFVACLGYSKKMFAFATLGTTTKSWISGLMQACEDYGGVPGVIQFDNAKAMVTKASQVALLNKNAIAFSEHYGCLCDTSRVATPTDNANAEASVKFITSRILVSMNRDFQFFSIAEVNAHLKAEVAKLNAAPFQKRPESRDQLFEEEKARLNPLPALPFKPFLVQKPMKVPKTLVLLHKGHEYSVPYRLKDKEVIVFVTDDEFIVSHKGKIVAEHVLSTEKSGSTILDKHRHPNHLAESRKSKETFMAWAKNISPDVEAVIEKHYQQTSNARSRKIGKDCLALQKLCNQCGEKTFSKACRYALAKGWFKHTDIELVVRAKAWRSSMQPGLLVHENIRGKAYFEGGYHE